MKHRGRLQLSFALIICVFAVVLLVEMLYVTGLTRQTRTLLDQRAQVQQSFEKLKIAVLDIRANLWNLLIFPNEQRDMELARLDLSAKSFYLQNRAIIASHFLPSETLEALSDSFKSYYVFSTDILATRNLEEFVRSKELREKLQSNQDTLMASISAISAQAEGQFSASSLALESQIQAGSFILVAFPAFAIAFAIISSLVLSHAMTRPLQSMTSAIGEVMAGKFDSRIVIPGRAASEFVTLGAAFNDMLGQIGEFRTHMEELVRERTQALESAQKKLSYAEKMASLGLLIAGVAHEVNTPLGNAITSASFLADQIDRLRAEHSSGMVNKKGFESFLMNGGEASGLVLGNLQKAAELVSSLRRIAVDEASDPPTTVNLQKFFQELVMLHDTRLADAGCTVTARLDDSLEVLSRPRSLMQVFENLMSNSLTHGLRNAVRPTIEIAAWQEHESVHISFRDNGIGISPELVAHIFDPFYVTLDKKGGHGIGMYVAYNLVASLGGTIALKDPAAAEFLLVLPAQV